MLDHKREFHGTMETTNGRYAITIRLDQSKVYIEEIEKLYKVFQMNGLPWKTINHPYAYKFFDVTLMRGPELKDDEEIVKCVFDLEEFEQDKQFDKIPLWNIERLAMKTVGFPTPALDKVNYEHILSIRKTGTEHGYLVAASEEDQVRYIKRSNDELTIIAQKEQSGVWELIKISQPMKIDKSPEEYEVVSNRRINNFVTKYAQKHTPTIRSRGEISRMINSFEAAKDIELDEVTLLDAQEECNEVSYPMNPFISDSIRVEQDKKIMLLHFKAMTEKQFYCNDTLSFLVSEVQMHFPEYKCRGTWV